MSNCKTNQGCHAGKCIEQAFVLGQVRAFTTLMEAYAEVGQRKGRNAGITYEELSNALRLIRDDVIDDHSADMPQLRALDEFMSRTQPLGTPEHPAEGYSLW